MLPPFLMHRPAYGRLLLMQQTSICGPRGSREKKVTVHSVTSNTLREAQKSQKDAISR